MSHAEPEFPDSGWSYFLEPETRRPQNTSRFLFPSIDQGLGRVLPNRNMKCLGLAWQNIWTSLPHFKSTWDLKIWIHTKGEFGANYFINILSSDSFAQQTFLPYSNWGLVNKILMQVQLFRDTCIVRTWDLSLGNAIWDVLIGPPAPGKAVNVSSSPHLFLGREPRAVVTEKFSM